MRCCHTICRENVGCRGQGPGSEGEGEGSITRLRDILSALGQGQYELTRQAAEGGQLGEHMKGGLHTPENEIEDSV